MEDIRFCPKCKCMPVWDDERDNLGMIHRLVCDNCDSGIVGAGRSVEEAERNWNKAVKEYLNTPRILDSGNRTEFATGAVRDMREGKGRMDLMPLGVVEEFLNDSSMVLHGIRCFMEENDTRYLHFSLASFVQVAYENCRETMILEVGKQFEEGAKKYGENNWQLGIEPKYYIDSAIRHYLKWRRGDKDEPHDRAFVWNIMCCIWECDWHKKEEKKDIPSSLPIDDHDAPVNVESYKIAKGKIEADRTCDTCKYGGPTMYEHCDWCRYYRNWAPKEETK